MRVLGRIRLSRLAEESTSPERQQEDIERWAASNDHEVVAWARDMDVSGSVDPFETPALGPWLTDEKKHEWDILCAWKLDRVSRRAIPMGKLFAWLLDNDKALVCTSDSIDLSTPMGRLIAYVIVTIAEGELDAIRERTKASHRKLRELGRWPGGRPAYGYRAQPRADAAGWELVPDPRTSAVLAGVIEQAIAGMSIDAIARDLTERGVASPSGRGPWRPQTLRQLLRSKTLLGHVTHRGVTVRDAEGLPIRKGPPLIDQQTYDLLQQTIESRSFTTTRTAGASPLLGVAVCFECGATMHFRGQTVSGKLYRYYRCPNKHGREIRADEAEGRVEYEFLTRIGALKRQERVYIPGNDTRIELDEAVRAAGEITTALGTITPGTVHSLLRDQLSALDSRIKTLQAQGPSEPRWEHRETGQTYRDAWESLDAEGRRQLMLRSGITMAFLKTDGGIEDDFRHPADLLERISG